MMSAVYFTLLYHSPAVYRNDTHYTVRFIPYGPISHRFRDTIIILVGYPVEGDPIGISQLGGSPVSY